MSSENTATDENLTIPLQFTDAIDAAAAKVAQLCAISAMTHGWAGEELCRFNHEIQDNFHWAIHQGLCELGEIIKIISKQPLRTI